MAQIHLIIGPVGSGKSTFALRLAQEHQAIRLTLDEWMTVLFRPDRPPTDRMQWYLERTKRCIEQIWRVTRSALDADTDVVLEIGLIQQSGRAAFYSRVDQIRAHLTVYVLDAPREVRRQRVIQRNQEKGETFSMEVPPDIFELASDLWEPPNTSERKQRNILDVDR